MAVITIRRTERCSLRCVILICVLAACLITIGCSAQATHVDDSAAQPPILASAQKVDINSSTIEQLEKIPHIGRKLAERIVDPDALLLQGAADPTRLAILRQLAAGIQSSPHSNGRTTRLSLSIAK